MWPLVKAPLPHPTNQAHAHHASQWPKEPHALHRTFPWSTDPASLGSTGGVRLLTNPPSAGYTQNPISVYYCCGRDGGLQRCIAEVTNTPWGARVSFLFDPRGQDVPKALHVSPFMDMRGTWCAAAAGVHGSTPVPCRRRCEPHAPGGCLWVCPS